MPGYNAFHGVPCTCSKFLLNYVLRKDMGFDGIVVSDYGAIKNIKDVFGYVNSYKETGIKAITAGVDVDYPDGFCFKHLPEAGRNGDISEDIIDKSPYRVLKMKKDLGLSLLSKQKSELKNICLDTDENRKMALEIAKQSDVIIAAMGENRYLCGECCDRTEVGLHKVQENMLNDLCDTGKPVILLIFGGRPLAVTEIAKRCAAVIYAWYPGEEGGNAIADILPGVVNPSGKLTVTLPDHATDTPTFYQKNSGINKPYPFGFGLSYTDYEYSELAVDTHDEYFDISFNKKNTGERAGKETVQIYIKSDDNNSKRLIGFTQVELNPSETKRTGIRVYRDYFARYNSDDNLMLIPFDCALEIGASSNDIRLNSRLKTNCQAKQINARTHYFSEQL